MVSRISIAESPIRRIALGDYILRTFSWKQTDRSLKKSIKKNFPKDYKNFGLTPYGYNVVLGLLVLEKIMQNPERYRSHLDCDQDLLLQTVIAEIEESLFEGNQSIIMAPESDELKNEYQAFDVITSIFSLMHFNLEGTPEFRVANLRFLAFAKHGLNITCTENFFEFFDLWTLFLSKFAGIRAVENQVSAIELNLKREST